MVMGPTHAMSGAAFWLVASAFGSTLAALNTSSLPVVLLGTIVCAGASLAPDIDSHSSTVVNSLGIFGKPLHKVVNGVSLAVHETTRTKYDKPRDNGHRTLFHTAAIAILMGALVSLGSSLPGEVGILGKDFPIGQLISILVLGFFLNLGLAGIFEKQVKKARKTYGPYVLWAISTAGAFGIAALLPEGEKFSWLGIAVGVGWVMHILGDAITKLGSPFFWPLKIRGKRWYDVALPSFMRIKAGGAFEKFFLLPALTLITALALFWHIPGVSDITHSFIGWIKDIIV